MPRPRLHDLGQVLDTAERLLADSGPERLTVRGLAAAAGVSNGVIYHAFGSLPALLGQVWLRAATDFLHLQATLVEDALEAAGGRFDTAVGAVVAAADAPAAFALRRPAAARMLMRVQRDRLLGPDLPQELAQALLDLDRRLVELMSRLARALWGRADGPCVEVITLCVVDLPTAVFHRTLTGPVAGWPPAVPDDSRRRLAAAVRAVLTLEPPGRPPGRHTPAGKDRP